MGLARDFLEDRYPNIVYIHTNENLDLLIKGLNPSPKDNILSVCGSGDQVFALLDKGAKISAIDTSYYQIQYSKKRLQSLSKKDFEDFFILKNNRFYDPFSNGDFWEKYSRKINLENLNKNKDKINFLQGDIFSSGLDLSFFNKVYLSNAIEHTDFNMVFMEEEFFKKFREGTLIYAVMHNVFERPFFEKSFFNSGFRKESFNSKKFLRDSRWNYFIYKKK